MDICAIGITIFGGFGFLAIGLVTPIQYYLKKRKCTVSKQATIVDYIVSHSRDNGNSYRAVFKFRVDDFVWEGRRATSMNYKKWKKGEKVQIWYNPDDPDYCVMEGDYWPLRAVISASIAGLIIIAAMVYNAITGGWG